MKGKKMSKQTIVLIVIATLIVALVVIICVGTARNKKSESVTTVTSTTFSTTSEDDPKTNPEDEDIWKMYAEEDAKDQAALNKKYKGRDDVLRDKKGNVIAGGGLYKYTLKKVSPKPHYYYFNDEGVYDPKYTGTAYAEKSNGDLVEYRVKNGRIDRSFNGLISNGTYLEVFENGKFRQDYTGKIHFPDGTYDVKSGEVYGYMVGTKAGYVLTPVFWSLDDEPEMYHNNS